MDIGSMTLRDPVPQHAQASSSSITTAAVGIGEWAIGAAALGEMDQELAMRDARGPPEAGFRESTPLFDSEVIPAFG